MSHLIVLPGNSPSNKLWGKSCVEYFSKKYSTTYAQFYDHWENGEKWIDINCELEKLQQHVAGVPTQDITIMAKSMGSILAVVALNKQIIKPMQCYFFGMPLSTKVYQIDQNKFAYLQNLDVPATAFHNDNDPIAEYNITKNTITNYAPHISFVTCHADNHDYTDYATYQQYMLTLKS